MTLQLEWHWVAALPWAVLAWVWVSGSVAASWWAEIVEKLSGGE